MNKFATSALFLLILIISIIEIQAQDAVKAEEKPAKKSLIYKLRPKYPVDVYNSYKMTDSTKGWRIYSDSTVIEYERKLTFFFTIIAPEAPEKGFKKLKVSIDSCRYKFTEGDAVFEFNSQDEHLSQSSLFDLTASIVPLGKEFEMVYSPYGEVAKIEGERLDWLKKYVLNPENKTMDTVNKYIWLHGISNQHLRFIVDLQKGIIPYFPVTEDSVWKSKFEIELDGITFHDTVSTKLAKINRGIFVLESTADSLQPSNDKVRLYAIKTKLTNIDAGRGKGTYTVELTPRGSLKYAEADFYAEVVARIRNERFIHKINSNIKWELLGQYTWE